jgi:cytochrome P450
MVEKSVANTTKSNGDDWVRHRKLTAPCFSERASATVWSESLQQSEILLGQWLSHKDKKMNTMVEDTSTLALNVISSVAFENDEINKPNPRHTLSLRDTLETVISTSISPAMESVLPWLKSSELQMLLPTKIKKLLVAMKEFRQYSDETIARERAKENTVGENKMPTLISTLINANDEIKSDKDGVTKTRLSDIELRGNIFIFIGAGLEPTAITLSYALALLAIHPDIQAWVQEELDDMIKANGDDAMDYTSVFPKLKRVMAIMVSVNKQPYHYQS